MTHTKKDCNQALADRYLLFNLDLLPDTPVHTILEDVAIRMQQSPVNYQFPASPRRQSTRTSTSTSSLPPLCLLKLVSKGTPRQSDLQIRLSVASVEDGTTIGAMMGDKSLKNQFGGAPNFEGNPMAFVIYSGKLL